MDTKTDSNTVPASGRDYLLRLTSGQRLALAWRLLTILEEADSTALTGVDRKDALECIDALKHDLEDCGTPRFYAATALSLRL